MIEKYIEVRRKDTGEITYGGDQNFFPISNPVSEDYKKAKMGCGGIATADVLLYLANTKPQYRTPLTKPLQERVLAQDEYENYYNEIYRLLGGTNMKIGMHGLKLVHMINAYAARYHLRLRASWGVSGAKRLERIESMLQAGIPVIICIPPNLLHKDKKDHVTFYTRQQKEQPDGSKTCSYRAVTGANGHYVVITELYKEKRTTKTHDMLGISSWGKHFYMDYAEFEAFTKRHKCGDILGNIVYLRQI